MNPGPQLRSLSERTWQVQAYKLSLTCPNAIHPQLLLISKILFLLLFQLNATLLNDVTGDFLNIVKLVKKTRKQVWNKPYMMVISICKNHGPFPQTAQKLGTNLRIVIINKYCEIVQFCAVVEEILNSHGVGVPKTYEDFHDKGIMLPDAAVKNGGQRPKGGDTVSRLGMHQGVEHSASEDLSKVKKGFYIVIAELCDALYNSKNFILFTWQAII